MSRFSSEDKVRCAISELRMRKVTYPKKVTRGAMSQEESDWQIGCMQAIVDDYRQLADAERDWIP